MKQQSGAPVVPGLHEHDVLGDYAIVVVAGTGGMGVVYKARQRTLGRLVALKVIRQEIARTPEYRQRFLREARLAASVSHPHVVTVYDVGDQDEQLFLAMQWVDGHNLKRVIERDGRLAPDRAVTIASQLAGALDAVHGVAGLVHRDVKPANVLLGEVAGGDHAYLTDFGVAKPSEGGEQLTQTGWMVGTTGYLSPEQIRGEEPGPRSDLYALGCLFFEALTGRPPFRAPNEAALRWAHANDPRPTASVVLPGLGDRYDDFLATALAVDPAQRFGSGREFAQRLAAAHAGEWSASTQPVISPHVATAVGPPTPIPPATTPPPGGQIYHAYGYATPPPAHGHSNRSGNPLALILLGIVALAGLAVGALAAAGVFSHASPPGTIAATGPNARVANSATSPSATSPAITSVTSTSTATRTSVVVVATRTTSTVLTSYTSNAIAGLRACDPNISADAGTSCSFAETVFYEYSQSPQNPSGQAMTIYDPMTSSDYAVTCTPDQQSNVDCYSNTGGYTTFSQASVAAYTPAEAAAYAASTDLGNSNPDG
jgi:serine/threonine protein kinase